MQFHLCPRHRAPIVAKANQSLKDTGYVAGENVAILYRWAENRGGRLPSWRPRWFADGLPVIATAGGSPPVLAAKAVVISKQQYSPT
jgi:putative ABC transport system substrate-binding protein